MTIRHQCFIFLVLICLPVTCAAQSDGRNMEKEKLIWQSLKAIAPGSVDTFKTATEALDRDDYNESARLYEQVLKKAPDFEPAMRRLGGSLVELGRTTEGMALLERAVEKTRSPDNLFSLAQYLA